MALWLKCWIASSSSIRVIIFTFGPIPLGAVWILYPPPTQLYVKIELFLFFHRDDLNNHESWFAIKQRNQTKKIAEWNNNPLEWKQTKPWDLIFKQIPKFHLDRRQRRENLSVDAAVSVFKRVKKTTTRKQATNWLSAWLKWSWGGFQQDLKNYNSPNDNTSKSSSNNNTGLNLDERVVLGTEETFCLWISG